jgi:hypothetical protein
LLHDCLKEKIEEEGAEKQKNSDKHISNGRDEIMSHLLAINSVEIVHRVL